MDMQHLLLLGRATQDSELLETKAKKDKKQFAVFSLAVNRYLGKEKEAEVTYYDCVCFSNAEKLVEKVKKGDRLFIQGRPTSEAYINKDGAAVSKLKLYVESWELIK
jgi:single-stranded DNA-binding protein